MPDSAESLMTLDKIEAIGNSKDRNRPAKEIKIAETIVLENPFRNAIGHLLMKEW